MMKYHGVIDWVHNTARAVLCELDFVHYVKLQTLAHLCYHQDTSKMPLQ